MSYFTFFLLLILAPCSAFALLPGEYLEANIQDTLLQSNIIILNRGRSDGMDMQDHLQIYDQGQFVTRALALEVSLSRSYWMIYATVKKESLKKNKNLQIKSLHLRYASRKALYIATKYKMDYVRLSFNQKNTHAPLPLKKLEEKKMKRDNESIPIEGSKELLLFNKRHSKDNLKVADKILQEVSDAESDQLLKKALAEKKRRKDIGELFQLTVEASPVSFSRVKKSQNFSYGVNLSSKDWENKKMALGYRYSKTSALNLYEKSIFSTSSHKMFFDMDIKKIAPRWTYFTSSSLGREKNGALYPARYRLLFGPAGLKYELYRSHKILDFSLSYIPMLEVKKEDVKKVLSSDGTSFIDQRRVTQGRHALRAQFIYKFTNHLKLENLFWYRPAHHYANKDIDWEDALLENKLDFIYSLGRRFKISYQNNYTWNRLYTRHYQLPSSNMTHTFALGYQSTF